MFYVHDFEIVLPVAHIHLENYHSLQGLSSSVVKGRYTKNFQSAEQYKKINLGTK